ncbi:hypothetical protein [Flavobacterium frigoris]|uniref:Uncharacterized protein n=1 Tax=Flavobacterium frigoris TaxID=229204 RepID=A0A1H9S675_FLAFI|nr:hypothetical protein [Flavobacterium frigoris]SER80532.1 hypothetical protein SAMN05444355_1472 [Flavobacterium frigoris]
MVNFVRIYRNNEFTLLAIEDYLKEYHSQLPEGWTEISNWLDRLFDIKNEQEYKKLSEEMQVEIFDLNKIKTTYSNLNKECYMFDDDILKFISFLFGTAYFLKIGNPTLQEWLSAVDINHPFKTKEDLGYGYSFLDALQYEYGQNIVRKDLLSTLRWIGSQGGS